MRRKRFAKANSDLAAATMIRPTNPHYSLTMNNLMPEKRLDRLGRLVTRWVKGDPAPAKQSILGTILPVIPNSTTQYLTETTAADKELRTGLLEGLHITLLEEANEQFAQAAISGHSQEDPLTQYRIASMISTMEKMDTETLQVIWDSPCEKSSLSSYLRVTSPETELREELHYMVPNKDNKSFTRFHKIMFAPIKKILETDDLSSYPRGSTEYEAVSSVLQVLHKDWGRRTVKDDNNWPDKEAEERYVRHLLELVTGHPDHTIRIKEFLFDRNVCLDEVDMTLLDDYLNNPTPALGRGLL